MVSISKLKELSFLVYGLGVSGKSVVNFFEKNNIKNYQVWDDKNKNFLKKKRPLSLARTLKKVNYIVLSPGISLKKSKNKRQLNRYKKKIITDIDLVFLLKNFFKSIVVTGTNGKSTTCKILSHILTKSKYHPILGGNIGTPILNLKIKKDSLLIIEASSFQLAHSKFIKPDYGILLNISNDHLDWHGTMKNYINSKFKIFEKQEKKQFSFVSKNLKLEFKKRKLPGTLVSPNLNSYKKFKNKIENPYLKSNINDENMSYIFELSKFLGVKRTLFLKSLNSFKGLPHRYEIFLKNKNCVFINDSKATTFQASKYALKNTRDIYWILGGLPKRNDKINLKNLKKNIVKVYLVGKNISFFKKQISKEVSFFVAKNLRNSVIQIIKDIKIFKRTNNTILLSPASASFDQFPNFEKRGDEFKKLSKFYAKKYI